MNRHGGSIHLVRPDRIVRTGVLSPIVGYQPQTDVLMVTQEFTSGPAAGMQLSGIGDGPIASWFKMMGARIRARLAERRAAKMMLTDGSGVATTVVTSEPTAAVIATAPVVPTPIVQVNAPQTHAMAQMAAFLAMRGSAPMRGEMFTRRRWNSYYYAG